MVMAPEQPPRTSHRRSSPWVWSTIVLIVVLAVALVVALDADERDGAGPAVTPGPQAEPGPGVDVRPESAELDLGSGDGVAGSGSLVSEVRSVGDFTGVVLAGEGSVVLTQSDTPSVQVRSDDNLVPLITTEIRGDSLHLATDDEATDIDPTDGVVYEIATPHITHLEITGAGSISVDGLVTEELSIELSGAGSVVVVRLDAFRLRAGGAGAGVVRIAGEVRSQEVTLAGAVGYDAPNLRSATATVDSDSVETATVWATTELDIVVRNTGSVAYWGAPAITSRIEGIGEVRPLGTK